MSCYYLLVWLKGYCFVGYFKNNAMKFIGTGWGLLYTSLVFCTMHIGWIYLPDLVFVFGVALFYGFCLIKTKSIVGVTMAQDIKQHVILVMPFVRFSLLRTALIFLLGYYKGYKDLSILFIHSKKALIYP